MASDEGDAPKDAFSFATKRDWIRVLVCCIIVYTALVAVWAWLDGPAALHELWQ